MSTTHLVLGTAGHIDHGKSALVQALTGTDPDRLLEEKQRGITIELGFAQVELPDGSFVDLVDVPGHEKFVRQMIAGATGIDIALLCIAADDGIMPQTREHLSVLELLGIEHIVVALTKTDLVDEDWIALMIEEIKGHLAQSPYADAAIIPVSAKEKTGLDELKSALMQVTKPTKRLHQSSLVRLPIDRSFTIKGAGTVITGTLWSGQISVGDKLELLPAKQEVRVREIQHQGQTTESVYEGQRSALNLAGLGTDEVRPGMFLVSPNAISPSDRFDCWLSYLGTEGSNKPLLSGSRVRVAHGTTETAGRILLMDGANELPTHHEQLAQIRLDESLPLSRNDRFIIRSISPVHVIGGGRILRTQTPRRSTLTDHERKLLEALRANNDAAALDAAIALQKTPFSADDLAHLFGLDADFCQQQLLQFAQIGKVVELKAGDTRYYTPAPTLRAISTKIENVLIKFHAEHPQMTGIAKAELKSLLAQPLSPAAFDALVAHLANDGQLLHTEGLISHPSAGTHAKQQEAQTAESVFEILEKAQLTPPSLSEIASALKLKDKNIQHALTVLEREGRIITAGDYHFTRKAADAAKNRVVEHLTKVGSASAADLKEVLGVSRKHAIPLLEYLDAKGITKRDESQRRLA